MLQGFHAIISTYGFWLPNDPRGSWSDFVRRWELTRFGMATKVNTRQSVAAVKHDVHLRKAGKRLLTFPEVTFTGKQALSVAKGFAIAIEESDYPIFACSNLPQHVHLIIGPHTKDIRRIIGHLKGRATQRLAADGLHPLANYLKSMRPRHRPGHVIHGSSMCSQKSTCFRQFGTSIGTRPRKARNLRTGRSFESTR